jgi:hypothetical protein
MTNAEFPNDELMTNERMTKNALTSHIRNSSFGLRSSFWFRHSSFSLGLATLIAVTFAFAATLAVAANVEFELVTERGFTPASTQKWFETFNKLKAAGVRIRSAQPADKPKIDVTGKKESPRYKVVGTITARGVLIVPGGQFTVNDGARIAKWMRELESNGVEGVTTAKTAFDLTNTQLEQVTHDLKQPVEFSTKGVKALDAARKLTAALKLKTTVADEAKRGLAGDDAVRDELRGLSTGTALAAVLRPAGAILRPAKPEGGDLGYRIDTSSANTDSWPIGWPSDASPAKLVPKLFEFLNAEIDGVTAAEAIDAIGQRLEVPLLLDHNNMARHRIDLAKELSLPAKRTYYSKVLDQVLFAVDLKYELRVDENDKPFLWITTLKR